MSNSTGLTIQETQAYIDAIMREDFNAPKLLPIRIAEQLVATMKREDNLRHALHIISKSRSFEVMTAERALASEYSDNRD